MIHKSLFKKVLKNRGCLLQKQLALIILILIVLALVPVQSTYAQDSIELEINVEPPEIGFFTVGDDIPVIINVMNNSNQTRYFETTIWFRPDQLDGNYDGDTYLNRTVIEAYDSTAIRTSFVARFPDLWWLIIRTDGFSNPDFIGETIGASEEPRFYVHPSSDRDIRILAESTARAVSLNEEEQFATWVAASAAIGSVGVGIYFGWRNLVLHRTLNKENAEIQLNLLRLNAMKEVFDLLSNEPNVGYRRSVYEWYCRLKQQKKPLIFDATAALRQQADIVEGAFDKAAFLVLSGLVDPDEFFELYHDMVLRFWVAVKDDITEKQKRNKTAGSSFQKLINEYMKEVTECPLVYCKEYEKILMEEKFQEDERLKREAKRKLDLKEEIESMGVNMSDDNEVAKK